MPWKDRQDRPQYRPFRPEDMVKACRDLARAFRAESAAGRPPIRVWDERLGEYVHVTRAEAARRLEEQGFRWETEAIGGPRNTIDRKKLGEP